MAMFQVEAISLYNNIIFAQGRKVGAVIASEPIKLYGAFHQKFSKTRYSQFNY